MRKYEFTPSADLLPVFIISIGPRVETLWRDFDGHFSILKDESNCPSDKYWNAKVFMNQLTAFWKKVCRFETQYGDAVVDEIIDSVKDPDLQEFLNRNR